jgi:hypothetical protein
LDPNGNLDFAAQPIVTMSNEEFRASGYELVRRHFEDYDRVRLTPDRRLPTFRPGEAKKLMKHRRAVEIKKDSLGNLNFRPKIIDKHSLAHLRGLGPTAVKSIPWVSPHELFWRVFDEALASAPQD